MDTDRSQLDGMQIEVDAALETAGLSVMGPKALDTAAPGTDDCRINSEIVGAQGSCDGDVRIDPRCWRIGRIFGRNPLLRRADRIEALVMLVALVASLIAIPVAGVVGAVGLWRT